jgi:alpha-2-macroglobulin
MSRTAPLIPIFLLCCLTLLPITILAASRPAVPQTPLPVQVTVMAAETNKPVSGAMVEFRDDRTMTQVVASLTVDANGSGTVSLPRGNYQYLTRAAGFGTARSYLYLDGQEKAEGKVWLNKAASLSGRLIDGNGKPLAGFRMAVDRLFGAVSDENGRFRFDNLDTRGHDLTLEQPDWVLEKSVYTQVAPAENKNLGNLTLRRSASVELQLSLSDHKRLSSPAGVSVTLNGNSIWRNGKVDANGRLLVGMLPPGSYTAAISDSRMERVEQQVVVKEGEQRKTSLIATAKPPSLEIEEYGDVILANKAVPVRTYGLWVTRAMATISRIQPEAIINATVDLTKPDEIPTQLLKPQKQIPLTLKPGKNDFRTRGKLKLPPLSPGAYLLQLDGGGATARIAFLATDLGIVAKTAPDSTLLQALDLKSGKPLAKVMFYGSDSIKTLTASAADGTAAWNIKQQGSRIVARHGESLAVLSLAAEEGQEQTSEIKGYLYTERTAYRPGQTVFYKGVLRKNAGDDYQLTPAGQIKVKVTDSGDKTLFEENVTSSAAGSFHGQFTLPKVPTLGEYTITASSGTDQWQGSFKVLEYRKPEFEVKLQTDQKFRLGGSQIPLTLSARYYFGAPVAEGKIVWRVYSQPWQPEEALGGGFGEAQHSFQGYSEFISEGETVLNQQGEATITITAKTHEQPVRYTVEADVTDNASRQVAGSASLTVVPSLLDIRVKGEQYLLQPGKQSGFILRVADWQGTPKPDTPVSLTIEQQLYDKKSRTSSWKVITTLHNRTGKDGATRISYSFPSSGYWRLRAEAFDEGKRRSFDETYAWVWEKGSSWAGSYRELEAEFDKKSYKPGETARLILRAPAVGGSLLLTLEGRRIHQSRIIPIIAAVQVVEIPVSKELAPNIHVSASTIHNGRFYHQQGLLKVDHQPGKLELTVTPQQPIYAPGDTARITVTARADGKPTPAEISLALVDEAIFAVAPETREEIYHFFRGRRDHLVRTIHSFPRLYLGGASKDLAKLAGDDDLKGIAIRKIFKDTAAWLPVLAGDSTGVSTAEAKLPDNLTTWRATAIGHSAEQQFGSGQATFISRLPFMARLAPPRFMIAGDQLQIPGLLNDASNKEQQVKGLFEATGLSLPGETSFTGTVPAGGTLRRDVTVEAKQAGQAMLRLSAAGSEGRDALELALPILPRALQREQATGITLRSGQAQVSLTLPAEAQPDSGTLQISFSPTVVDSLFPALEQLIAFPYGCVEQTVSRFVPAVYVKQLLTEQKQQASALLEQKLPDILAEGLRRLADFQHEDGGWGWWKNGPSTPELTALVMQGLATAKQAGVSVDEQMIKQGKKALETQLSAARPPQVALLYRALTAHSGSNHVAEKQLAESLNSLPPEALIATAEAFYNRGDTVRASTLLQAMTPLLQQDREAAWLPDSGTSWRWGGSSIETTAALLSAASRITPKSPLNPALASYLARQQQGGWWRTTTGSAASVIALANYVKSSQEQQASYTARLLLGSTELEQFTVEQGRLTKGRASLTAPASTGENRLQLTRDGTTGTAYLSASLQYRVAPEQAVTRDELQLERRIYRIKSVQSNGQWRHEYQQLQPGEAVQTGEDLELRLVVKNSKPFEYVILEDHLPAGFELRQSDRDPRYAGESAYLGWYEHRERRDASVAWFISHLPPGSHEFRTVIYPELKGRVMALPTAIWPMYRPELRSESKPWLVEVK